MSSICGDCHFLNLTEKRQNELYDLTGMKSHHFCMKYKKILIHWPNKEPDITRCEECIACDNKGNQS